MKSTANIPLKSPGPSKTPHRNYKHVEFLPFSHIRSLVDITDRGGKEYLIFKMFFLLFLHKVSIYHGVHRTWKNFNLVRKSLKAWKRQGGMLKNI